MHVKKILWKNVDYQKNFIWKQHTNKNIIHTFGKNIGILQQKLTSTGSSRLTICSQIITTNNYFCRTSFITIECRVLVLFEEYDHIKKCYFIAKTFFKTLDIFSFLKYILFSMSVHRNVYFR